MSKVLGRVEFGNDMPNRYFVHDSTTGWSYPTLFLTPDAAWKASEQRENVQLNIPQHGALIRAVRKVLAPGGSFDPDGTGNGDPLFGFATQERLVWPLHGGYEEEHLSLQRADGIDHIAREVDGGFSGFYDHPLCKERWTYSEDARSLSFEELFGQWLDVCPKCAKKLNI